LGDGRRAADLLAMILPSNHARNAVELATYKAEPYVVAADVYGLAPHAGRGGWTWYTGSAGWLYRLILESILGLEREGNRLHLRPCMPEAWQGFSLQYQMGETVYQIDVSRGAGRASAPGQVAQPAALWLDGVAQAGAWIALVDDRIAHRVQVQLAAAPPCQVAA
jgi:cellobiose phosphorylase